MTSLKKEKLLAVQSLCRCLLLINIEYSTRISLMKLIKIDC